MALLFRRMKEKDTAERTDAVLTLTSHARSILDVDDDTVVSVSEHDCSGSGCCGSRTFVLILRPGHPTQAITIEKPILQVTRADLAQALAPLAEPSRAA
jgi:hypothetical protein